MLELAGLALAALTLPAALLLAAQVIIGHRGMRRLREVDPVEDPRPLVTVVVPARDEERKIEEALRSLLAQDYPNLEIVAVDDRSTDATGSIIDRLVAESSILHPIHIHEIPAGWLGKVHALHTGAEVADGEILLFADADVVMAPTTLSRAVGYLLRNGLDHVTVGAEMRTDGAPLLDLAIGAFVLQATRYGQPWRASDPDSDRYAGLGAFNLVRATAYRAIGGHEAFRMHPVDDLELGRRLKAAGFRQEMLLGKGMVAVEWYASARALVAGLRKNGFAAADFRVPLLAAIVLAILVFDIWPWVALGLTAGIVRLLNAGIVAAGIASYWAVAPHYRLNRWLAPLLPLGAAIILYSGVASAATTLWRGGISWRGTFYPLSELERARSDDDDVESAAMEPAGR